MRTPAREWDRRTTTERTLDRFANDNRWRNRASVKVVRFDEGFADPCLASLARTKWGVHWNRLNRLYRRLHNIPISRNEWPGPRS